MGAKEFYSFKELTEYKGNNAPLLSAKTLIYYIATKRITPYFKINSCLAWMAGDKYLKWNINTIAIVTCYRLNNLFKAFISEIEIKEVEIYKIIYSDISKDSIALPNDYEKYKFYPCLLSNVLEINELNKINHPSHYELSTAILVRKEEILFDALQLKNLLIKEKLKNENITMEMLKIKNQVLQQRIIELEKRQQNISEHLGASYVTPALKCVQAVIKEFWYSYDPQGNQPPPKQETVIQWIKENHPEIEAEQIRKAIDKICRHPKAKAGGIKSLRTTKDITPLN